MPRNLPPPAALTSATAIPAVRCPLWQQFGQTLGLMRENHAVHVEELHIVGMVTHRRLVGGSGRRVGTVRWAAAREGRTVGPGRAVHAVDGWLPSSMTCSRCGQVMDTMVTTTALLLARPPAGHGRRDTPVTHLFPV